MEKEKVRKMAQQMFEKGKSYSEISRKFNISESTLKSWKRRDDWQRATPHKKEVQPLAKRKRLHLKGCSRKKVMRSSIASKIICYLSLNLKVLMRMPISIWLMTICRCGRLRIS